eukprot:4969113-Alexandrium_andersonii.AAC.1
MSRAFRNPGRRPRTTAASEQPREGGWPRTLRRPSRTRCLRRHTDCERSDSRRRPCCGPPTGRRS